MYLLHICGQQHSIKTGTWITRVQAAIDQMLVIMIDRDGEWTLGTDVGPKGLICALWLKYGQCCCLATPWSAPSVWYRGCFGGWNEWVSHRWRSIDWSLQHKSNSQIHSVPLSRKTASLNLPRLSSVWGQPLSSCMYVTEQTEKKQKGSPRQGGGELLSGTTAVLVKMKRQSSKT